METCPWKVEWNLKIAVEMALAGIFRHQDKWVISVEAEFVWTRSQQAERCAHVG